MSDESPEREVEVVGMTAKERVMKDPVMRDIIFSYLDPWSVKKVRLVSRQWKSEIEHPKFWVNMFMRVGYSNVSEVMESRIIKLVDKIKIGILASTTTVEMLKKLFHAVVLSQLPQLKIIRQFSVSSQCDLSSIDPELLSQAVLRLEEFYVEVKLTTDQKRAILDKIIETEELKLKRFYYEDYTDGFPVDDISPDVVASSLVRLEDVGVKLSWDPVLALFNKIASDENIKLLKLSTEVITNLSHIPADTMAEAVVRLKEIDVNDTFLTPEQVQSIFNKIANCENLKLTHLNIRRNDLSSVPVDVLVEAISRLETVDLRNTHLNPDQAETIFHKIANCEKLKLTKLKIFDNDLSSVPADVLAEAISRLIHLFTY